MAGGGSESRNTIPTITTSEPERNLSLEVDAIRGKLNEMYNNQARMEDMMLAMKESLDLWRENRIDIPLTIQPNATTLGMPLVTNEAIGITQGVTNMGAIPNPSHEQPPLTIPLETPIGEGYRSLENIPIGGHGHAIPVWEPPRVVIQKQPFSSENSRAEAEKGKLREEWMEKIQEQIKAIQGPSTYGYAEIEQLCPPINTVVPKDYRYFINI